MPKGGLPASPRVAARRSALIPVCLPYRFGGQSGLCRVELQQYGLAAGIVSLKHFLGGERERSPHTTRNYAIEIPTFEEFARVSKARCAMAKPRRGKTTFMIIVSPLPGKYELEALAVEEGTRVRSSRPAGSDTH